MKGPQNIVYSTGRMSRTEYMKFLVFYFRILNIKKILEAFVVNTMCMIRGNGWNGDGSSMLLIESPKKYHKTSGNFYAIELGYA